MVEQAQAFHWINKDIKYKKCYRLLKDKGYLALFWYMPSGHKFPATKEIDDKVDKVVKKYTRRYAKKNKPTRMAHNSSANNDERKAELEESGLFNIISELSYTHTIRNNLSQYIKAMKSVPAFAAVLDGLNDNIINKMDQEIEDIINSYGGFVDEEFYYALYIAQKNEYT